MLLPAPRLLNCCSSVVSQAVWMLPPQLVFLFLLFFSSSSSSSWFSYSSLWRFIFIAALLRYNWHSVNCTYLKHELVSFGTGIHLCKYFHNREGARVYLTPEVRFAPLSSIFLPVSGPHLHPVHRQSLICFLSLQISFHILDFYVNILVQCVLFFIQPDNSEIHSCGCISQKIAIFVPEQSSTLVQVWAITIKLLWTVVCRFLYRCILSFLLSQCLGVEWMVGSYSKFMSDFIFWKSFCTIGVISVYNLMLCILHCM